MVNHSRFSDELKTRLADVKLAAQRFASHAVVIASKERQNISQQNHSIMHLQYQNMHFGSLRQQEIVGKLGEIESQVKKVNHRLAEIDRFTRINLLEILEPFLDTTQDASMYTYMFTHVPTCMPTCIHTCIHVHFRPNRTRALTRRQQ